VYKYSVQQNTNRQFYIDQHYNSALHAINHPTTTTPCIGESSSKSQHQVQVSTNSSQFYSIVSFPLFWDLCYQNLLTPFNRWFAITMGTGVIGVLLYKLPYNGKWLYELSIIIFVFDLVLYLLFCLISALRYTLYPELWSAMLNHPTESLFLGACPMGLGILIQLIVDVCVPAWGTWAITLAWTLWWIEVVASVAICFYLPFMTYVSDLPRNSIESLTNG